MKKIRLGFVGCGGISYRHINDLRPLKNLVSLEAFADPISKNAIKLREAAKAKGAIFKDYRRMLKEIELDAVEIASPHMSHYQQIKDSLEKNLHVLVEKPMVIRSKDAKELIALAKKKRKILSLSYQRHTMGQYRYAKKLLKENQIGRIEVISALMGQNWIEIIRKSKRTWRFDPKYSGGGMLMDSGSHLLAEILWLTGLIAKEVFALLDFKRLKVDVNSAVTIRFNNGVIGNISIEGNDPAGFRENLYIYGEKGVIALGYKDGWYSFFQLRGERATSFPRTSSSTPDKNFINAILGKEKLATEPEIGLKVAELSESIYKSAKTGRKVKIE